VQILKNNIKNTFYKGIGALVPYKTPLRVVFYTLGLVRQINPYKTRSLIYYESTISLGRKVYCKKFNHSDASYEYVLILQNNMKSSYRRLFIFEQN
jgi:hypothetical protein